MAYTDAATVKTYLGISLTTDDTLITALISRAQAAIDRYTLRTFEASSDTTRYFTVGTDTDDRDLWFDDAELCAFASTGAVITDADGTSPVTLTLNTHFICIPRNSTPWYGLRLLTNCVYTWTYSTDPEKGVTVKGKWAYSASAPADIAHACIRLASYFYRQKDAQVFDITAVPDAGILTIPQGIPADVKLLLDPYKRTV